MPSFQKIQNLGATRNKQGLFNSKTNLSQQELNVQMFFCLAALVIFLRKLYLMPTNTLRNGLYNDMLDESLKSLANVPLNKRSESMNKLVERLNAFKSNPPRIVFSKSNKRGVMGWAQINARIIHINEDYRSELMADEKKLKELLLHESIHLAGFLHGTKDPEFAYTVSTYIFGSLSSGLRYAVEDVMCHEVNTEKYSNGIMKFFKTKQYAFACDDKCIPNHFMNKRVNELTRKEDGNETFLKNHMQALADVSPSAQNILESWDTQSIGHSSNSKSLGVFRLEEENLTSRPIDEGKSNIYGFKG